MLEMVYPFPPLRPPEVYIRVLYEPENDNGKYTCEVKGGRYDGMKLTEVQFRMYAAGRATLDDLAFVNGIIDRAKDLRGRSDIEE